MMLLVANATIREVLAFYEVSLWCTLGKPPELIRLVLARDPSGEFEEFA